MINKQILLEQNYKLYKQNHKIKINTSHLKNKYPNFLIQKEFLSETQSVLSNVKQKLIESFEALATFLVIL